MSSPFELIAYVGLLFIFSFAVIACASEIDNSLTNSTWSEVRNFTYQPHRFVCKQEAQDDGMIILECMQNYRGMTAEEQWEHNVRMGWGPQP